VNRYFLNPKTRQFIQIANTILDQPFDKDWIEITKPMFDDLLAESRYKNEGRILFVVLLLLATLGAVAIQLGGF